MTARVRAQSIRTLKRQTAKPAADFIAMTSRQSAHGHRHGQAAQPGKGGDDEEAAARADQEAPSHRELPVGPVGALAPAAAEHGGGGDDHHDREGDQQDDVGGVTPTMNKEVAMASSASTPAT
ncbi:hypothetical protein ABT269_21805 [Streptomyces viridosporus]|uniref:hypothetical protein n=1 Tax=Streptomyces viridosporus TaxID=67581 RepID=UPI003318F205